MKADLIIGGNVLEMAAIKDVDVIISSHGLKTGPIPKADFYIDCRGIPEPHGRTVREMRAAIRLLPYTHIVLDGLNRLLSRRGAGYASKPYHIITLCAWGMHRSVMMKQLLAEELAGMVKSVEVK